jgi:tRNA splicing ligase
VFLEKVEGFLLWWSKHKRQFSTIAYLARTILGIPSSHIEIERIYFIASILINLRNCHLDLKNLDLLVLLIKNWLDDPLLVLRINEDLNMWMGLVKLKRRY